MPWSKFMVTGGVEPSRENLSAWFNAGVYCVGMGSKLFPKNATPAEISDKCRNALEFIETLRK